MTGPEPKKVLELAAGEPVNIEMKEKDIDNKIAEFEEKKYGIKSTRGYIEEEDEMRRKNHEEWTRKKEMERHKRKEEDKVLYEKRMLEEKARDKEKRERQRLKEEKIKEWQEHKEKEKEDRKRENEMMRLLEEKMRESVKEVDRNELLAKWVKLKNIQRQMELDRKAEHQRKSEEQKKLRQVVAELSYQQWKLSAEKRGRNLPKNGFQMYDSKPQAVVDKEWNDDTSVPDWESVTSRSASRLDVVAGCAKDINMIAELRNRDPKSHRVKMSPSVTDVTVTHTRSHGLAEHHNNKSLKDLQTQLEEMKKICSVNIKRVLGENYKPGELDGMEELGTEEVKSPEPEPKTEKQKKPLILKLPILTANGGQGNPALGNATVGKAVADTLKQDVPLRTPRAQSPPTPPEDLPMPRRIRPGIPQVSTKHPDDPPDDEGSEPFWKRKKKKPKKIPSAAKIAPVAVPFHPSEERWRREDREERERKERELREREEKERREHEREQKEEEVTEVEESKTEEVKEESKDEKEETMGPKAKVVMLKGKRKIVIPKNKKVQEVDAEKVRKEKFRLSKAGPPEKLSIQLGSTSWKNKVKGEMLSNSLSKSETTLTSQGRIKRDNRNQLSSERLQGSARLAYSDSEPIGMKFVKTIKN